MSYDPSLYRSRPAIKQAMRDAKLTQPSLAALLRMPPSTLGGKINGSVALDDAGEAAILEAIEKHKGVTA